MRVLITMEEKYRAYREAIADVLRTMRPRLEVLVVDLDGFEEQLERFDPHAVIYGGREFARPEGPLAWVELSPDPDQATKVWVEGRRWEVLNPELKHLVAVMDEVAISCLPPLLMASAISRLPQFS